MNSILSNNKILLFFNFSFYLAFTLPLTIIIIIIKTIDKLFNSSRINECNITENVRSENEKKLSVQNFQFTFKSDFFQYFYSKDAIRLLSSTFDLILKLFSMIRLPQQTKFNWFNWANVPCTTQSTRTQINVDFGFLSQETIEYAL